MAKHKPRQFWAAHVAAAQASRTSKADYCREHGLDYKTLLRWISRFRFRGAAQTQTQMQSLVPMAIRGTQAADNATLMLRIGPDVSLSVPASTDAAWLGKLLRAVSTC